MIKIPSKTKAIRQSNRSNVLGQLWGTFGVDLSSNKGKIRFSPRGLATTKSTDEGLSALGIATSFNKVSAGGSADGIYATAGAKLFKNSGVIYGNFSDSVTGGPTDLTDGGTNPDSVYWNTYLYVTGNNKIYKMAGSNGTWATITGGNGIQGSMVQFSDKLYFVNGGSQVAYTDGSSITKPSSAPNSTPYTVSLGEYGGPDRNNITCLRASSNRIWIATINKEGGKGKIWEWDGQDVVPIRFYTLESAGAIAMAILDDVPWIMDVDGRLLYFNGGAFVEADRLPIKDTRYLRNPTSSTATERFIHFNGMSVQEDRILMLINNQREDSTDSVQENIPSGIWEYSKETGLYCKQPLSTFTYQFGTDYTDYALNRVERVGALATFKSTSGASNYNGSVICGLEYYTNATTTAKGIFIDDTNNDEERSHYFITPQLHSEKSLETWQGVKIIHQKNKNSTDAYNVRYRTEEVDPTSFTGTWTSTTTFTTTTDVLAMEGQEVEVLNGQGSGLCAIITKIDWDNTNYTVTLDRGMDAVSGTFSGRVSNWRDMPSVGGDYTHTDFPLDTKSRWVQFKVIFTGKNLAEIDELQINHTNFQ